MPRLGKAGRAPEVRPVNSKLFVPFALGTGVSRCPYFGSGLSRFTKFSIAAQGAPDSRSGYPITRNEGRAW
jgi:hypothetical protein